MKSEILKCLLISFFISISLITSSQGNFRYIPVIGFEGESLLKVDSLSFLDKFLSSEYYVDSITKKSYTGKIKINYKDNAYDFFNVVDGVKDGWQRLYLVKNEELLLYKIEFYDQSNFIYISNMIQSDKYKTSSFIRFSKNNIRYFFEIKYKKSKKIIVLFDDDKSRNKLRFKDVEELEDFFNQYKYEDIYPYCKNAGFFGDVKIKNDDIPW